ncbi:hypothetical protein CcaverHIS002_0405520 [Cutaneotrichosporon cavernicola]|uniref:Dynamin-type G domain-containing protein n=1 Tax=Cutaneotrichosporon cavernicola TaxID=279322 RepID=A0AA48L4E0_9TREE|nr:uncharacterized protein CcaverHIS019_0405520 [Cutaneotrichosporon cavernicola]BEI83948.1 hypothetical protein CcaverHIS002_0405520 [Cutaneotrichosporon cavernicola]BEI91732.1 hypothetical protein CcaverHIS019_0405520 [Cutaneotrichosporon cavernicola]BEI99505.1 hypothetical protein CcaverHIS631_0405480 [Cutaneotrichosporon cavernicola]
MQPYRPASPPGSPTDVKKESHIGFQPASAQARIAGDAAVRDYEAKQQKLSDAIDATKYLVADIKNFNHEQWKIRYPHFAQVPTVPGRKAARPGLGRRTLTFADEPAKETEVVVTSQQGPNRHQLKRSVSFLPSPRESPTSSETSTPMSEEPESLSPEATPSNEEFTILNLDLNLGATRHAKALISQLERSSISALLDNRLIATLTHLDLLHARIHDAHSRVLITGDLNAGKSTLVNALLRRSEVMPTDQQPLTTRFVEVVSARENGDKEEIHILDSPAKYNPEDASTYKAVPIEQLEELSTDYDCDSSAPPLRVFLRENTETTSPSILHNGVVDISLIDAPGLNRDSIKTTANFARQEEIDVVVFVVSAANHFTLSAKEFIWQASHEKAHLFIVVNRFDQIKDKERCRRAVMAQIKQLSPETYAEAKDLVHFVDSAKVAFGFDHENDDGDDIDETFAHLEQSLRSFVLVNRAKSKLGPAQNYVTHLMADVELLAAANSLVATKERDAALQEVERVKPELDRMKHSKDLLEEGLVTEEESATGKVVAQSQQSLRLALDRVGRGEFAPDIAAPVYPGLLGAWDYAVEVRKALLASLDVAVRNVEDDARVVTSDTVTHITDIGDKHLPADVEKCKRVFNPQAMFYNNARKNRRVSGLQNVGLGLVGNPALSNVVVSDIFDLQHFFCLTESVPSTVSDKVSPLRDLIPLSKEVSSIGVASLAVGAFSVVGGKAMALRTLVETAIHLSDLAANPVVRKWAGPAIGVLAAGAVAYVIYELPRSIPRNVGRNLRSQLLVTSGATEADDESPFFEAEAQRIGREVRKVMRLAAWDLRERFRIAMEARNEIVRQSEETAKQAARALEWFAEIEERVDTIRDELGLKL